MNRRSALPWCDQRDSDIHLHQLSQLCNLGNKYWIRQQLHSGFSKTSYG